MTVPDLFDRDPQGGSPVKSQLIQSVGVGSTVLQPYTVAANELTNLQILTASYAGVITGVSLNFGIRSGGVDYYFDTISTVIQNLLHRANIPPNFYLVAGDIVLVQILGVTIGGSNLTINLFGNKFFPDVP